MFHCLNLSDADIFLGLEDPVASDALNIISNFFQDWTSLSPTDHVARQECLQKLQPLAEMDEYIKLSQNGITFIEVLFPI